MKRLILVLLFVFVFVFSNAHAFMLVGKGYVASGSTDGFVGLSGTPDYDNSKATDGADEVGYSDAYTATSSGIVRYVHIYINTIGSAKYNVGIYNSDGSTLLKDSTAKTLDTIDGYNTFQLDSDLTITSGVDYIIGFGQDDAGTGAEIGFSTESGSTRHREISATVGDAMPATMQGAGTTSSNQSINIYADNTP